MFPTQKKSTIFLMVVLENTKIANIFAIILKILASWKSPCDGIGEAVKRVVSNASLQLPTDLQILNVKEMFNFLKITHLAST